MKINTIVTDGDVKIGENQLILGSDGAAGYDVAAWPAEEVTLFPDQVILFPTGVCLEIPTGFAGFIFSRSGLGAKNHINVAQNVGVIDSDYQGEIFIPLRNEGTEFFKIQPGMRVAQLVFLKTEQAEFNLVEEFSKKTEREAGGFGSTGT